jgi:hypothetical protein
MHLTTSSDLYLISNLFSFLTEIATKTCIFKTLWSDPFHSCHPIHFSFAFRCSVSNFLFNLSLLLQKIYIILKYENIVCHVHRTKHNIHLSSGMTRI